jgi:hypothetical protein
MKGNAPTHFGRAVRGVLCDTYQGRWIGRGGPTAWPACSPDFNRPYVFVLRHLNTSVCVSEWVSECASVRVCVQLLLTMKRHLTIALRMPVRLSATAPPSLNGCGGPWWDASRACTHSHGEHFELYNKRIPSDITHKLNVSWLMLI